MSLASSPPNSSIHLLRSFVWNSFFVEIKLGTVTTRVHVDLQLRWSFVRHCRLLPHTKHHSCISTMSSMNFKCIAHVSTGRDTHSWLYWRQSTLNKTEVFLIVVFTTINTPYSLHLKLWKTGGGRMAVTSADGLTTQSNSELSEWAQSKGVFTIYTQITRSGEETSTLGASSD